MRNYHLRQSLEQFAPGGVVMVGKEEVVSIVTDQMGRIVLLTQEIDKHRVEAEAWCERETNP